MKHFWMWRWILLYGPELRLSCRLLHNINYLFRKNYSSYYFWEDINEYMVVIMLTNLVNFDTVTEGAETEVDKNTSLP